MITQTQNMDLVNSILRDPGIWYDIAPQGVEPFDSTYSTGLVYFLVNETDGVIIYHPFRDGMKIHPNIIPGKRGKKTFDAIEQSIQRVLEYYHCIYAEIDPALRHVTWLARHLGFTLLEHNDRDLFVRRKYDS